jgi:hypothetical protein
MSHYFRIAALLTVIALPAAAYTIPGDIDLDGDVDIDDVSLVLSAAGSNLKGVDPRDFDSDNTLTVLDARKVAWSCTLPGCRRPGDPLISSATAVNMPENQPAVIDIQTTDPSGFTEGSGLTYSLAGGADVSRFSIAANSGLLSFTTAPDFEAPTDANTDNHYEVTVMVTNSGGKTGVQSFVAAVTNVVETCDSFYTENIPTCVNGSKLLIRFQNSSPGLTHRSSTIPLDGYAVELSAGPLFELDSQGNEIATAFDIEKGLVYSDRVLTDNIYVQTFDSPGSETPNADTSFARTVHFGELVSSTAEAAQCPACSGGTQGTCQNSRTNACASPSATGRCPRGSLPCTETVVRVRDILAFSSAVDNWDFQTPSHQLRHQTTISLKGTLNGGPGEITASDLFDTRIDLPTNAVVVAPDGQKRVVGITNTITVVDEYELLITWFFSYFGPDETFYYN